MPKQKWKMDYLVAMMEQFQTIRGDKALDEIFNGAKEATDGLFQNSLSHQAGSIIVPAKALKKLISDLQNCDFIGDIYRAFSVFIRNITGSGPNSSQSEDIRKLVLSNLAYIFGPENNKMITGPIPSETQSDSD